MDIIQDEWDPSAWLGQALVDALPSDTPPKGKVKPEPKKSKPPKKKTSSSFGFLDPRNNPHGIDASIRAASDAVQARALRRGGQTLSGVSNVVKGPRGKMMGVTGAVMEEIGKQKEHDFLNRDYGLLGKNDKQKGRLKQCYK